MTGDEKPEPFPLRFARFQIYACSASSIVFAVASDWHSAASMAVLCLMYAACAEIIERWGIGQ